MRTAAAAAVATAVCASVDSSITEPSATDGRPAAGSASARSCCWASSKRSPGYKSGHGRWSWDRREVVHSRSFELWSTRQRAYTKVSNCSRLVRTRAEPLRASSSASRHWKGGATRQSYGSGKGMRSAQGTGKRSDTRGSFTRMAGDAALHQASGPRVQVDEVLTLRWIHHPSHGPSNPSNPRQRYHAGYQHDLGHHLDQRELVLVVWKLRLSVFVLAAVRGACPGPMA